jgi:betaine-aldehyde dehydrogenase
MNQFPNQLLIDGRWRDASSGKTVSLVNPATEETFLQVASADPADADEAAQGAHRAFQQHWRDLSPGKRTAILMRIASLIRQHQERIAQTERINIGKPIADAREEAELGARIFEYYAGAISRLCGETIPVSRGGFDFTLRQPMGVVAAIVPWNFPFPIACWKVAPALASGNCVLLKPASLSPITALILGELCLEAGLPAGVLQVVPGSGAEAGEALVSHPLVRKISFTGSTAAGKKIMQLAASSLKRVSLELGGKSPNIIFADSDWERAAEESPSSVFGNAGQDCCARSRIFVERPIYEGFVEKFIEATEGLSVGDPSSEKTRVGPLVSEAQRNSVEEFIREAERSGRSIAAGGRRPFDKGFFLEPAILLEVELEDRCWREEIFGPVVCIRSFTEEEKMVEEVNSSPYGLSGSIWTNDLRRALRVVRRVESGVLSVNSHSSVHVEAPFGGFKQSGIGRDLGMAALEGYTELKNVFVAE